MKAITIFMLAAAAFAATIATAESQTVVTNNAGLAHDCFIGAKTGRSPRNGIESCTEALKSEWLSVKDKAATYDNRGVMQDALGRTEDAVADFNMSITLNEKLGDPYVNLGSMLIKKGAYQAALEQINKGMDLGISFPHIGFYDRALAEQSLGHYKEAYYDYKHVLELEPDFTQAAEQLKVFTVVPKLKTQTPS
jgi:lipoprotein NlpI